MLPHIIQQNLKLGLVAANNLVARGKPLGILTIGPMRTPNDVSQSFDIPESIEERILLAVKITKPWITSQELTFE